MLAIRICAQHLLHSFTKAKRRKFLVKIAHFDGSENGSHACHAPSTPETKHCCN
jgi:hypothetical protein